MRTEPTPAENFDTIVVGGGQTGLTIGHHLARTARDFVIFDAGSPRRRLVAPPLGLAPAVFAGTPQRASWDAVPGAA